MAVAQQKLKILRTRINPDLFADALNHISFWIPEDPGRAKRAAGLLADMSRYALDSLKTEFVPLAHELEFVRNYLEFEEIRSGRKLCTELPDSQRVKGVSLPALILQPLIEEALRRAIATGAGGSVRVRAAQREPRFMILIENEMDPAPEPAGHEILKTNAAQRMIQRRLNVAY